MVLYMECNVAIIPSLLLYVLLNTSIYLFAIIILKLCSKYHPHYLIHFSHNRKITRDETFDEHMQGVKEVLKISAEMYNHQQISFGRDWWEARVGQAYSF